MAGCSSRSNRLRVSTSSLNTDDARIDPRECWFLPLTSKSQPDLLGIRLACPTYDAANHEDLAGVLVVLDTALGELEFARDIQRVEVGPLPATPAEDGYIELADLPRYLEWRRHRRGSGRS
jgi:hypothetical protein